jgi:hypothetical protein
VSLLAFVATSTDHGVDFDDEDFDPPKYRFDAPRSQVVDAAYSLFRVSETQSEGWYWIHYKGSVCSAPTTARLIFTGESESEQAELILQEVDPGECENLADECVGENKPISRWNRTADPDARIPSRDCLRQEFEELVIQSLQAHLFQHLNFDVTEAGDTDVDVEETAPQPSSPALEYPPELMLFAAMMPQMAPLILSWSKGEAIRDAVKQIWYKLGF